MSAPRYSVDRPESQPQPQSAQQPEQLQAVVERLTYHAEESGYTVVRVKVPRSRELVTVVGNFANIQAGQTLQMSGTWRDHPKYGPQFQVKTYFETKPATLTGLEKYLGSGLIKGVGPVTAKRIVDYFGLETLEIIEQTPERLIEVPSIGKRRVEMIQEAWAAQKAIKEVMLFLQSHGVSTTYAVKIYKQYGNVAIALVSENPYRLVKDIYGIGFISADRIARNLGIAPNSEFRRRSGILHVLSEAADGEGHCCLPELDLSQRVIKCLTLPDYQPDKEAIKHTMQQMVIEQELRVVDRSPRVVDRLRLLQQSQVSLAGYPFQDPPAFTGKQANKQILSSDEQTLSPNKQILSPDKQILSSDEPISLPNKQILSPDKQILSSDERISLPDKQIPSPNAQILSPGQQIPSPDEQIFPDQTFLLKKQILSSETQYLSSELSLESVSARLYYAPPFFQAEKNLAERLQQLIQQPVEVDLPRVQRWITRFTNKTGLHLSQEQGHAVEMVASQRVLILTGGPGCGKTFSTRTIVALWKAMGKTIALASPTGRAAQRLGEMAGQEAKTIHRLLEFEPKTMTFKRDRHNPLEVDAIVIDEASMLDLFLANSLIKAIPLNAHLLLVGDIDQLPSVGPGNVLRDLIQSAQIPVVRLTQVFRQAQTSQIVGNAHRINQGQFPYLEPVSESPQSDCLWLNAPDPESGVQAIQDIVAHLVPSLGFDAAQDVQVLCPMTRAAVGTRHLNQVLQQLVNPPSLDKAEMRQGGQILRVGDRVMQQTNDYDREVFNGDLGRITHIDLEEQLVSVVFSNRLVTYDNTDLNEITLAWATTIHKSQGSEYPVVILPLFMQHYLMLNRNLLYTGLTRGRKLAVLVGPQKAIGIAVCQVKSQERYTYLKQRLLNADPWTAETAILPT